MCILKFVVIANKWWLASCRGVAIDMSVQLTPTPKIGVQILKSLHFIRTLKHFTDFKTIC